ncbi:3-phosphoshikimate 1-carboxyvinyltransferase [Novimethylophilus kurashikiensis]|uniref:3-phosphoshikimate 1-carboxyvinyltransferase n=1 Tax=Novimethylophilus kurashikiensis TaxID=1825523 RepID=A0A2R5FI57_9PROT|nr:nucleotide-binding protein [Novimethylophilus kurashikiensis]GBG15691.1 3-phosphoshikimate 1-carboxyvinyltransferase [Novimethylophilus kurashikiensis]
MNTFAQKIDELVSAGCNVASASIYIAWSNRVTALLTAAIDTQSAEAFKDLGGTTPYLNWEQYRDRQVGHLEGLALRIEASGLQQAKVEHIHSATGTHTTQITNHVFLVHGHDNGTKETTARFIERLGLAPIILHEQANEGRTIIEKFEAYADVGFAIVLMTPDDVGASVKEQNKLLGRARQNVILELGYFTGRLGRSKVCALFKPGIEIPSDFHGVLFLELDEPGAWKPKLANELVKAGMKIDVQALLG